MIDRWLASQRELAAQGLRDTRTARLERYRYESERLALWQAKYDMARSRLA